MMRNERAVLTTIGLILLAPEAAYAASSALGLPKGGPPAVEISPPPDALLDTLPVETTPHANAEANAAAKAEDDYSNDDLKPVELPDLTLDRDNGITLTLEKSIDLAIRGATSVITAENNQKVTAAALIQSYGQFLPNLTAKANYTYTTGTQFLSSAAPTTVTGTTYSSGFTIGTDLNLFNGLSDYSQLKSANRKEDAAEYNLNRAKQQISLDISQSYLQVILDERLVDIARKNLQESQERQKLLTEQTRVGVRNLSDLFRQQAETSADEALLFDTENKTRADQVLLLRKLRADIAKKYHFVPVSSSDVKTEQKVEDRYSDESALMKTALGNRLDLKASDKLADAAAYDVKVNWAGYLPKLDLQANVVSGGTYFNNQVVNGQGVTPAVQSDLFYQLGNQLSYNVGLYLSWNIFDRFVTRQNVATARATADNLEVAYQDVRNQVEGDVRTAFGDYKTVILQLRSSKKGLEAAQKAYELMEGRYEVGSASFVDLITVQATLVQAESTRATALINYELRKREVEFAIGETPTE